MDTAPSLQEGAPTALAVRRQRQEAIFDALQSRLAEEVEDIFADAEKLNDLSMAVNHAAEALSHLDDIQRALG